MSGAIAMRQFDEKSNRPTCHAVRQSFNPYRLVVRVDARDFDFAFLHASVHRPSPYGQTGFIEISADVEVSFGNVYEEPFDCPTASMASATRIWLCVIDCYT